MMIAPRRSDRSAPPLRSLRPAERSILAEIRREPELSRAAIAARLGLSPALLSKTIATFLEEGWITERRVTHPAGRGQPALLLRVRPRAIAGLGLSLSTSGIASAVAGIDGSDLGTWQARQPATEIGPGLATAEAAVAHHLAAAERFAGIVIAVPALVDAGGEIVEVTPSQRGIDFAAYRTALENRFGLPVRFESRAPAIDEALRAPGPDAVIFVLFLDFGVGGSLVEGMRVFRGGFGQAGNIGGLVPETGPRPSIPDLAAWLGRPTTELDAEALERLARDPEPALGDWLASRGAALSGPLSAVVQLFNPSDIVVGGLFPRPILEALIARIDLGLFDHAGRLPIRKPRLRVARTVGRHAMAKAAAMTALHRVLSV